jgi:hypothetical protein
MIIFENIYYYIHSFFEYISCKTKPRSKSDIENQGEYEEISFLEH